MFVNLSKMSIKKKLIQFCVSYVDFHNKNLLIKKLNLSIYLELSRIIIHLNIAKLYSKLANDILNQKRNANCLLQHKTKGTSVT